MNTHLAPTVDWTAFSTLETLGIDEVALRKGQGCYVAVIWAQDADGKTTCWPCCRIGCGRSSSPSWSRFPTG
ncbi:MAG: hypothetical protein EKK71_08890 [Candidatus Competibacteraceae bacterium]|nr:MAG: hypothetical protein EKK71_08890 [Candidatus Competibacteraceae bacterium]